MYNAYFAILLDKLISSSTHKFKNGSIGIIFFVTVKKFGVKQFN